jgi:hypothetical protein
MPRPLAVASSLVSLPLALALSACAVELDDAASSLEAAPTHVAAGAPIWFSWSVSCLGSHEFVFLDGDDHVWRFPAVPEGCPAAPSPHDRGVASAPASFVRGPAFAQMPDGGPTLELVAQDPPTALAAGPASGSVGLPLGWTATGTIDALYATNPALTFAWSFGDGATGVGPVVDHAFAAPGTYAVTVTASDGALVSAPSTVTVTVTAAAGGAPVLTGTQDCVGGTVELSWTSVADATTYVVERQRGSLPWTELLRDDVLALGDALGVRSRYRVRACGDAGCSAPSNEVAASYAGCRQWGPRDPE